MSNVVDAVVGNSHFLLERHLQLGYSQQTPVRKVVYHGVAQPPSPPRSTPERSARVRIGYLGRLHPTKGVELLLDAFAKVSGEGSELFLAGTGDARKLLPVLARQYAPIDVFIHDCDHSAEFQMFECCTVKPFVSNTGLLMTHDAIPKMFSELAARWGTIASLVSGAAPEVGITLGGISFRQSAARADS